MLFGMHLADSARRRLARQAFIDRVVDEFSPLPFDLVAARIYARVWNELRASGSMIGVHDLQIGATALALGYDVLTLNVRDFERIPGLLVRRPGW